MTFKEHFQADGSTPVVIYLTAGDNRAEEGAMALERVAAGPERTVVASSLPLEVDTTEVDCIVFDGDPTAHADRLTSVRGAAGDLPIVVFADGPYVPEAVPAVDGYVRKDVGGAHHHLANEITRLATTAVTDEVATTVFETAEAMAACREREPLFDRLVAGADELLPAEYCWFGTINFGELVIRARSSSVPADAFESISLEDPLAISFRAREAIRIDDVAAVEWIEPPFSGARSIYTVPVSDLGVLFVASEQPEAFDEPTLSVIDALCAHATTVIERNWERQGIINERDRLKREREAVYAEREEIAAERDAVLGLFRTLGEPTVQFARQDGQAVVTDVDTTFEQTFGVDGDDLVGEPVADAVFPTGLVAQRDQLLGALEAGTNRTLECQCQTPDDVRTYELSVFPTDGTDGGRLVFQDVTAQVERDRQLEATTHRLEQLRDTLADDLQAAIDDATDRLDLAEQTGNVTDVGMAADAVETLDQHLDTLTATATGATDPVSLTAVLREQWLTHDTGESKLVLEADLLVTADREALSTLVDGILEVLLDDDLAWGADEVDPITVTVGAISDGFCVTSVDPTAEMPLDQLATAATDEVESDRLAVAAADGWEVRVGEDDATVVVRGVPVRDT